MCQAKVALLMKPITTTLFIVMSTKKEQFKFNHSTENESKFKEICVPHIH